MKQRLLLLFAFLVTMITGTWANEWSYTTDFQGTGTTGTNGEAIVGAGQFMTDNSQGAKFANFYRNSGNEMRSSYLRLPDDVLSHSTETMQLTIAFWVRAQNNAVSGTYNYVPMFTAYGAAPVNNENTFPMFACQYRGLLQVNNWGWCDYVNEQNVNGANIEDFNWLDDKEWHLYTAVFNTDTAKVYFDGVLINKWIAYNYGGITDTWQRGLFSNGADLNYICLGGNQAWNWPDKDSPFDYAHLTVSNAAWTDQKICDEACSILGHDYDANDICTRCGKSKSAVALTTPLTFEAIAEGTLVVSNPKTGMQYSVNEGEKVTVNTKGETYIYTVAGDRVQFYGNGTSITQYGSDDGTGTTIRGNSGAYNVYGNIMSLVDEYNYNTATAVGDYAFAALFSYNTTLLDASNLLLPATTLGEACYSDLFGGCSSLTAAPALPATTLAANCYRAMFEGCSLTEAPALPATKLGTFCYCFMFQNCSSLTTAPELPATTLAEGCYQSMFENCTSLTTAPVLPATTLAGNCYGLMFRGCTGLTSAPALPATTLAAFCYGEMFSDCTGLTTAPELPATTLNYCCYQGMFKDCTGLTTAPELPATTLAEDCYKKMFSGCTNLASVTCKATDISASDCTTDWLKDVAAKGTFTPADNTVAWVKDSPNGIPTGWTRVDVALATPLTIKALTAGTIKVNDPKSGMKYIKKNGTTSGAKGLLAATDTKTAMSGTTTINVQAGDEVEFYGDGTNITSYNWTTISGGTAEFTVYGNIMSLVDEENYATATTLADNAFNQLFNDNGNYDNAKLTDASGLLLPATTLAEGCYYAMFMGCTGLTAAPELPATTLAKDCYSYMFFGCTSLTAAPELPATTLAEGCYNYMFTSCTSLTAAPELPATTLTRICYGEMFTNCTSLTSAPALPATTLAAYCYGGMFYGCTSLTAAPELPATTLAEGCYSYMFSGCTNLSSVTCLATDFSATDCTTNWLKDVAPTGTFTAANSKVNWIIPTGWTRKSMDPLDTPLTVEATSDGTIRVNSPKTGMKYSLNGGAKITMDGTTTINVAAGDKVEFYGDGTNITSYKNTKIAGGTAQCSVYGNIMSLVDEQNFATATTLADNAFYGLFANNTTLTDASELLLPATTLSKCCYLDMFYGCTALTAAPALPATTLAEGCYGEMFGGCTALTVAPELPATTLAYGCYNSMFCHCPGLTTAPELPATTLAENCYRYMFSGCTALTVAPELPATELKEYCYYEMFKGCTNLSSVTCLATDISANDCTTNWLSGVAATGTFTGANNTVAWVKDSESGVPTGWTYNIMVHTHVAGEPQIDDASKVDPTCTEDGSYDEVVYCTVCQAELSRTTKEIPPLGHDFVNGICSRCGETMPGVAPALTIEATSDGTIKVNYPKSGMKYSLNGGTKTTMSGTTEINVTAGDKVRFYGNGTSITSYAGTSIAGGTAECKVYGNIMSLVDEESFTTANTLADYAFNSLFYGNTKLTDASGLLLPATTLAEGCYQSMFENCTSLTAAPELPGTTLAEGCYAGMFRDCTSLTSAPELPATTLAEDCYWSMFRGCTSLTAAPELPATTLSKNCYDTMFRGCTALTAAPALPATTLAEGCYYGMFGGCTSLTAAPELPATTLSKNCYDTMFRGCTALTAAPALPATTLAEGCYYGMFYGCTSLTAAPELPATTLAEGCYAGMFSGCTNLSSVICLATDISATDCTTDWLKDVAATGVFTPANGDVAWVKNSASGIPTGWTIYVGPTVNTPLTITAMSAGTIVVKDAKDGMRYTLNGGETTIMKGTTTISVATGDRVQLYGNGTRISSYSGTRIIGGTATFAVEGNIMSLVNEENFANATILSGPEAFMALFKDNTKLTDISGLLLPAVKLGASSYNQMFSGCTGLTKAPALPATELGEFCYSGMFSGCTGLTAAPALPATKMADGCYNQMFKGCTALTAAPALPATELAINCYNQMFYGCTALTAAPALPAMTVEILSYNEMFKGCTGLTAAPALPATTLAVECYFAMFEGCTGLTAAPALPAATLAEACYGSMFKGCTGLTKAPVLPAAKLVKGCYQHMFQGCAELAAVTCLATDISAENCTYQWLEGVAGTGAFTPANETVAWEKNSNSGIPTGWSGGPATGLNSVNADAKDAVIYDLMGRKVTNARRGMYILNGKKVVKK